MAVQNLLRQCQRPVQSFSDDVRFLLKLCMRQCDACVEVADVHLINGDSGDN